MNVLRALKAAVAGGAWRLGLDLVRHQSLRHPVRRRALLIHALEVDLVIDVGANEGQYAQELRAFGYKGDIISLEPLAEQYRALAAAAKGDPKWRVIQSAAGAADEEADMFVAANGGASSSILPMLPLHEDNAPFARIVGQEHIHVRRLDHLLASEVEAAAHPFIKVDVQGFEGRVLDGAEGLLRRVVGLQVELQLFPLYEGAPTFAEMLDRFAGYGFELAGFEPAFTGQDGRLLAADGIFIKRRQETIP
jgi:FkbM family methyltransferase